jgi:uridine kinase
LKRPYIIGIAGGSCSGKTTLAVELAIRLGSDQTARIAIDSYYHGLSPEASQDAETYNFDDPRALDHELFVSHLHDLSQGRAVNVPIYDFTSHARTPRSSRVDPVRYVILDGLFLLYWDDVRSYLGTKVFIDVPQDVCLTRRLVRDTRDRGRSREEVVHRYHDMTQPMFENYVGPTRRFADIVVDGRRPVADLVPSVVDHIEGTRC